TNVPQLYSSNVKIGSKIDMVFPEHPGQTFQGTLVHTANSIDPGSRTLLIEIDVDNRKGELLPGSLAQVQFKANATAPTFVIPAAALIFRTQGTQGATLTTDNKAHLVPVVIGEDGGAAGQIWTALQSSDRATQDPPDSIIEGERLSAHTPRPPPATGGK